MKLYEVLEELSNYNETLQVHAYDSKADCFKPIEILYVKGDKEVYIAIQPAKLTPC